MHWYGWIALRSRELHGSCHIHRRRLCLWTGTARLSERLSKANYFVKSLQS